MAPEVALDKIELLTKAGDTILDPMCGSGTVVRLAAEEGRIAIGSDLDPLAVLITRTASKGKWSKNLEDRAEELVTGAKRLSGKSPRWIDHDRETSDFVSYWFAPQQAEDLSRLARVLEDRPRTDDPLRVALSRMIVTKDGGASLARDTAHSRPHRVRDQSEFDVLSAFVTSARKLATILDAEVPNHQPHVRRADARSLGFLERASVDLVVTSPPYLNAIDYLRGHRLSLIWMGWTIRELRALRGIVVGAERGLYNAGPALRKVAAHGNPRIEDLTERHQHMVLRFTKDMDRLCRSLARVIRPGGHLVFVVADSQLGGVPVSNSGICTTTAQQHGFELLETTIRPLPTRHRYLPPPTSTSSTLSKRMKEEVVLTFSRSQSPA